MRNLITASLLLVTLLAFSAFSYAAQTKSATNTRDAYAPFEDLFQVTPSDATTYDPPLRGCIIEVAGDIAINPIKSASNVTISVLKGQLIPVLMTQVLATGTTATMVCGR